MKIIVVGCGRMGLGLANELVRRGHEVNIVDNDTQRLCIIKNGFSGKCIAGVGFDKETLERANIQVADAVVSCTNSDESNALIARIARNVYRVPTVVARLYDPRKATIYNALGIQTISTTSWGIQKAVELIDFNRFDTVMTLGDADVEVVRIEVPVMLVGRRVQDLTKIGEILVTTVIRENKAFVPTTGTILQKDDILFVTVALEAIKSLKHLLGMN